MMRSLVSRVVLGTTGAVSLTLALTGTVRADQFHYNNILIGTRSVGMGGAFGAVADDASGVYYNPAGLAFALSNDISGSANAFYNKSTTYKKTLGNEDFVEESSGSVPSFFGGLQKLDRYVEGLVFAFGVYSTDSDLKDQNTVLEDKQINSVLVDRYHRTSNARASTYFAGAGVGMRLTPNVAVGIGGSYMNADELVQEYQGVRQTFVVKDPATGGNVVGWRALQQNTRERLAVHGFQPVLGVQAALPGNLALGLTVKKGLIASQSLEIDSEANVQELTPANDANVNTTGFSTGQLRRSPGKLKVKEPVGEWPAEIRLGLAWFASPTFLLALDAIHHTAVTSAEKVGEKARFNREAVTDFAVGAEYYVAAAFPLRFGVFTNNDARPEVQEGGTAADCADPIRKEKYCDQADHIDYVGESLFIAWVQPNSQIAAGVVLQQGKGKAQKVGGYQVQDVEASSYTFAFSATHNL